MKCFSLKSACGHYLLKHLKEHSAVVVVVKKEFWLRKAFNFFKSVYKIKHYSMKAVLHALLCVP